MAHYTLTVSNHPEAGQRIPTAEALKSWKIVFDGPATADQARLAVDKLSETYRHVQAFKGRDLGKLWYAVLRMS